MFSLGRAYEQIGEHKRSLKLYESANIIDWQYLPIYNKDLMTKLVERIVEEYSAQEDNKSIRKDLGQVFICGNFRSGSTLLEQMLAAHSNFAGGESVTTLEKLRPMLRLIFRLHGLLVKNQRYESPKNMIMKPWLNLVIPS